MLSIPEDEGDLDDLLYVIVNDSLVEMEESAMAESVMKTQYECVELAEDPGVLVAVVCHPHQAGGHGHHVRRPHRGGDLRRGRQPAAGPQEPGDAPQVIKDGTKSTL